MTEIEPIRLAFDVAVEPERAFALWTESPSRWWPASHTTDGEPGSAVVFEPFAGGRVYERTPAGEEIEWGRIAVWEPPSRLAYTWHMRTDRADATDVEISFAAAEGGCRVEIAHSGWERLGARGPGWRERNTRGWSGLLPHFVAAAEQPSPS